MAERLSESIQHYLREIYKLREDEGKVTVTALARRLNVSSTTIHEWGRAGWLGRKHYGNRQCLFEPIKSVNIRKGKGGRLIPSFVRPLRSRQETV